MSTTMTNGKTRTKRTEKAADSPLIKVSEDTIDQLKKVFKMLSDPARLKIVLALAQEGELHVKALCDMLGQTQPAVSHHLTLMRYSGLVNYTRRGKHNFYYVDSHKMRDLFEQFFTDSGNGNKAIQFENFALTFRRG